MNTVKRGFKICKEQKVKIILAIRIMGWKWQNGSCNVAFSIPKIGTH